MLPLVYVVTVFRPSIGSSFVAAVFANRELCVEYSLDREDVFRKEFNDDTLEIRYQECSVLDLVPRYVDSTSQI